MTENRTHSLAFNYNWTFADGGNISSGPDGVHNAEDELGQSGIVTVCLTLLFFIIGVVGICGNSLVIFAVIFNKKMRTSMTNLLITNLAFADLVIMVFGIPETIQFMMRRGWTLERIACKVNRYILVTSLYGSVLTLIALCVERLVFVFTFSL